ILRSDDSIEFHNPTGSGIRFELYTKGEYQEISYRSILAKGLENMMMVGRCWSCDQLTLSANRNIGLCMGMGQAAGTAAAMALKAGVTIRKIDVKALQREVYPLKGK
ncbi:MAG: FAD-dependent oxidoreductase, partial [Oscillospiraceae bacterium]|nr:FAD-dependent oxidoreductase [Oscillospiraceae bacterium]